MMHLPILPFLIPFLAAGMLLLLTTAPIATRRAVSLAATLAALGASVALLATAENGPIAVYRAGGWPPPFGIVLVADRVAALMVTLLFTLAVPAVLMAIRGTDARGLHFHALFQLQLSGIAGAFLTGDLFNLFVFFEILLIASYALLLHTGGLARVRAGLLYVSLNLVGSSLFLVALGLIYGTLGTLNIADIAWLLPMVPPSDVPLVRVALALLALVFLLKGALFPMAFWLPHVYSAASVPVATLFAIMTKVGIVALLRLSTVVLDGTPAGTDLFRPWLPALALLTIALGVVAALAARRFAVIAGGMVLVSSGTLLFAVADGGLFATAAILYYLPHTTLVTAGMFLLAGAIADARGALGDRLVKGPAMPGALPLGLAFAALAVAVSGLPPLSGFLGKLMLMQGAGEGPWKGLWWTILLVSGLFAALVLARTASVLFWEPQDKPEGKASIPLAPLAILVAASPALTVFAQPVAGYARAAASQLHDRTAEIEAVMKDDAPLVRDPRP